MKDRWWPGAEFGLTPTGRTTSKPIMQDIAPKTPEVKAIRKAFFGEKPVTVGKDLSKLEALLRK